MRRLLQFFAYRLRTRPRLGRLALGLIPDIPWQVDVPGLGAFTVRLRRNRSLWLRNPLDSESFPFAMLRHLVRPGDVVYDAGANLGLYSRFFATELGASRVLAFEPVADNRALLARNLALGRIADRVTVLPVALSQADGSAEFQLDDMQSASGTLSAVTGGGPAVGRQNLGLGPLTAEVPCRSLDSLIAEGQPRPAVIKLDVEGAEAMVLRGGEALLRRHHPHLLIELHGAPVAREVLPLLEDLGYAMSARVDPRIHPGGYGRVDSSLLPRILEPYDVHFVVATRDPADLPAAYSPAA